MARSVELLIRQKLKSKVPSEQIITDWITSLRDSNAKPEEVLPMFCFAYNSGHWSLLVSCWPQFFENKWPVHWGVLIEIVSASKIFPPEEVVESVLKGAKKQNLLDQLVISTAWDHVDRRIGDYRKRNLQKLQQDSERERETLWEKLGFLRTQRMIEEEKKLLEIMRKMYPEDPQVHQEYESFQDRWARHLLTVRSQTHRPAWSEVTQSALTTEEQLWVDVLVESMKQASAKDPSFSYDLAIGLYFMNLFEEALSVVAAFPDCYQKEWLRLELLLKTRRFVEVLSESQRLEVKYSADPESTFAAHYLRAQALRGLGQYSPAVELMNSLINIRPNYRSAQSLLSQWIEEGA